MSTVVTCSPDFHYEHSVIIRQPTATQRNLLALSMRLRNRARSAPLSARLFAEPKPERPAAKRHELEKGPVSAETTDHLVVLALGVSEGRRRRSGERVGVGKTGIRPNGSPVLVTTQAYVVSFRIPRNEDLLRITYHVLRIPGDSVVVIRRVTYYESLAIRWS